MKNFYILIYFLFSSYFILANPERGQWTQYIYTDGISSNYVFDIEKDGQDRIWVGTQNGVTLIDGQKIFKFNSDHGLPSSDILQVKSYKEQLYVVASNKGIYKFENGHFQKSKIVQGNQVYTMEKIGENIFVSTNLENVIFNGDDVSFMGNGFPNSKIVDAFLYQGKEWYVTSDKIIESTQNGFSANKFNFPNKRTKIQAFLIDGDARYIGTDRGLFIQKKYNDKIELIDKANVLCISKSKMGLILIGAKKGVYYLKDSQLKEYVLGGGIHKANIKSPVRDIEVISSNEIWLSTFGMGIYLQDPGTFKSYSTDDGLNSKGMIYDIDVFNNQLFIASKNGLFIYRDDKIIKHLTIKDGLPSNTILDLEINSRGDIWLATANGLSKYSNSKFKNYSRKDGLPSKLITTVHIDKNDENIVWSGSENSGLTRYENNKFVTYSMKDGLPSNTIRDIIQSNDGEIFIACYNSGLSKFNGQKFELFEQGLDDKRVVKLEVGLDNKIWAATESAGIGIFENDIFTMVKDSDGLAHNEMFSLYFDGDRMWASTFGGGVSCFTDGSWITLRESDGLPSNTIGAISSTKEGRIVFGSDNGLSILSIDNSKFQLNVDKILTPQSDFIYNADINISGIVNDRFFINLNPIIYNPTKAKIGYRTRILTKEKNEVEEWSDVNFSSQISFIPKEIGDYVLEIQAVENRIRFSTIATIPFEIRRIWYIDPKTAIPFWGGLFLLIGFSVITYLNYLKKSKEAQNLRDAEIERKDAEMEEAREFQQGLLPTEMPESDEFEMIGFQKTATEVGGDFFDFMQKNDGSWIAICGDATGHGLTSGNVVSITKTALSSLVEYNPVPILDSLNKTLLKMNIGLNRMCLNIAHLGKNTIKFSSAGMPPAYFYSVKKGELEEVMVGALPLGSFKDAMHMEQEILFKDKGDIFIMMSDGLPEAENSDNEMIGYDRTEEKIRSLVDKPVKDIKDGLVELCNNWLDIGTELKDDMTFVIIKKK